MTPLAEIQPADSIAITLSFPRGLGEAVSRLPAWVSFGVDSFREVFLRPLLGLSLLLTAGVSTSTSAEEIVTNAVVIRNPPAWLTERRVEKAVDRAQAFLEWDIRKVQVTWYFDESEFFDAHKLGNSVVAFANKQNNTIHIGPRVNQKNFDSVFAHELTHIVLGQKYKSSIPKWLEEGLANAVGKYGSVDYSWLQSQTLRPVRGMEHPFKGLTAGDPTTSDRARYHYVASSALIELIASKCKLNDLLQLSVEKGLENYLPTFCRIKDLDAEFKAWVSRKAGKARAE